MIVGSFISSSAMAADPATLNDLIQNAVSRGDKSLTLPPERYEIANTLVIRNAKGLTIDGQGSTIVMTNLVSAISIDQCADLTLSNLTIDYNPLPFTQGTVTAVSSDGRWAEFDVHNGYPALTREYATRYLHLYNPSDGLWKPGASDYYPNDITILSPRKGRANFSQPQQGIAPGDLLALDIRKTAAVMVRSCSGPVAFDRVMVLSAPGISFLGRFNSGQHIFRQVTVKRGPRPAGATQDRLMSSSADAVNYAMGRKGPILDGCDFSFMGDDSFNVHGAALPIMRVESDTSVLVARPQGPEDFESVVKAGDTLRLLAEGNYTIVGRNKLASFARVPSSQDVAQEDVARIFPRQSRRSTTYTVYRITFESPMAVQAGQWLDLPDLNSPGFIVRNSFFHDHRARALRIMASDGLVENNRFERITAAAISIGPEFAFWREAGWTENLLIRSNQLLDIGTGAGIWSRRSCTPGAIAICAATESKQVDIPDGHRNITLENNVIDGCSVSGVHAFGVSGLTLRNNRITGTNRQSTADTGKDYGLSAQQPVETHHASQVVLDNSH